MTPEQKKSQSCVGCTPASALVAQALVVANSKLERFPGKFILEATRYITVKPVEESCEFDLLKRGFIVTVMMAFRINFPGNLPAYSFSRSGIRGRTLNGALEPSITLDATSSYSVKALEYHSR